MTPQLPETVVDVARRYWNQQPVYLDTETTGLTGFAEIVEICVVDFDGKPLMNTLVKPCRGIPQDVIRIHGITNEMVRHSPTWPEVWAELCPRLMGRMIGIYNSDFDTRMMRQTHQAYDMPWEVLDSKTFCIMKMYARFCGITRWQKLQDAARQCRISMPNAHRALADTLIARAVFEYMVHYGK